MTINSVICNLIENHPNDWRDICTDLHIKVKDSENFSIFNYDVDANFYNPIVQEARGIIINRNNNTVACWPFRKFCNSHEPYADTIDWTTAQVQEKIDGSIVKMWYNKSICRWVWSSNSCINASDAMLSTGISVLELIKRTSEYELLRKLIWDSAEPISVDYTYIFELVSPYNQVVVHYDKAMLYHIGTRNNKTGREYNIDLGIQKPKVYPLHSLEDCISTARTLNTSDYPDKEGFVVVDADWNRVKVKSPAYLIYHHAINNGVITKEKAWEMLNTDDFNINEFLKVSPQLARDTMKYYIKAFEDAKFAIEKLVIDVIAMVNRGFTRKDIALNIANNKYKKFGFKAIDMQLQAFSTEDMQMLIDTVGVNKFLSVIDEFKP